MAVQESSKEVRGRYVAALMWNDLEGKPRKVFVDCVCGRQNELGCMPCAVRAQLSFTARVFLYSFRIEQNTATVVDKQGSISFRLRSQNSRQSTRSTPSDTTQSSSGVNDTVVSEPSQKNKGRKRTLFASSLPSAQLSKRSDVEQLNSSYGAICESNSGVDQTAEKRVELINSASIHGLSKSATARLGKRSVRDRSKSTSNNNSSPPLLRERSSRRYKNSRVTNQNGSDGELVCSSVEPSTTTLSVEQSLVGTCEWRESVNSTRILVGTGSDTECNVVAVDTSSIKPGDARSRSDSNENLASTEVEEVGHRPSVATATTSCCTRDDSSENIASLFDILSASQSRTPPPPPAQTCLLEAALKLTPTGKQNMYGIPILTRKSSDTSFVTPSGQRRPTRSSIREMLIDAATNTPASRDNTHVQSTVELERRKEEHERQLLQAALTQRSDVTCMNDPTQTFIHFYAAACQSLALDAVDSATALCHADVSTFIAFVKALVGINNTAHLVGRDALLANLGIVKSLERWASWTLSGYPHPPSGSLHSARLAVVLTLCNLSLSMFASRLADPGFSEGHQPLSEHLRQLRSMRADPTLP